MIPQADIIAWSANVPWPTLDNVEQDLILSQLMIEIARHPLLGNELVMRGGTCFHKLWLPTPLRYSEDLDYVRRSDGPDGPILSALARLVIISASSEPAPRSVDIRKLGSARFPTPAVP